MNQSILFPDLQHWDEEQQVVVFFAQQNGALIECIISLSALEELAETPLAEPSEIMNTFSQWRFDLEESAEQAIDEERFNASGQIVLTREQF